MRGPKVKKLLIGGELNGEMFTDFVIAPINADAGAVLTGRTPMYCQVGSEAIADYFVAALNAYDAPIPDADAEGHSS